MRRKEKGRWRVKGVSFFGLIGCTLFAARHVGFELTCSVGLSKGPLAYLAALHCKCIHHVA